MKILYPEEHHQCLFFHKENAPIEIVNISKGETYEFVSQDNHMVFVMEGTLHFSSEVCPQKTVRQNHFTIHPADCNSVMEATTENVLVIMRLPANSKSCLELTLEKNSFSFTEKRELFILKTNSHVNLFLDSIVAYMDSGLFCSFLFDIKIKEFFYILKAYYPIEDVKHLMEPVYNRDRFFSELVMLHYKKSKNVRDLASKLRYSQNEFEKHFKKNFKIAAKQWLHEERAKNIYEEINNSHKSLKAICHEYGFGSPSIFNDYCKRIFHHTPGAMRKKKNLQAGA